ncbi:glycosyltransferase family 10 domain-containing protein [Helicobacter suis]|uniref:glycosyltransferase family 10 domain-containing protein n=1 Tax=Helicobacter suis TaxID=104628 RepID=UPI000B0FBB2F|nr:glycosyltransferase family 10 [Helicobacter suis]
MPTLIQCGYHKQNQPPPPLNLAICYPWSENQLTGFKESFFYYILNSAYDINLSRTPPCDIVFETILHKQESLNFPQKRIGFTGENMRINFDIYDFGMGFDDLTFGERYLRVPLYYLQLYSLAHIAINFDSPFDSPFVRLPHEENIPSSCSFKDLYPTLDALIREQTDPLKRAFASFVASNPNAPMRNACYQELNTYAPVASGGRVFNTLDKPISNKAEFLSQYKFNLCFENSKGFGYTTEKIIDAYFAHTIPIYWGNPAVAKDFNPKSFINVHDFKDFTEALDFIRYLDTHDNAYLDMLHAHPLNSVNGKPQFYQDLSFAKILAFLQRAIDCKEVYHTQPPPLPFHWKVKVINKLKRMLALFLKG